MRTLARILTSKLAVSIARWLLGLIFIVSAIGKIADPAAFADNVAAFRLLPVHAVNIFAIALPWVELLVGLSLLNGVAFRSGALLAGIMNVVFVVAAATAVARGLDIECGCFTAAKSKVGWALIVRDVALLVLAIVALLHTDAKTRTAQPDS